MYIHKIDTYGTQYVMALQELRIHICVIIIMFPQVQIRGKILTLVVLHTLQHLLFHCLK